jgi:cephalosporin hydroxylase
MLALLDYCDAAKTGTLLDPQKPSRHVLGIDIDIRDHNREALCSHPLISRIKMIQGSSVAPDVVNSARQMAKHAKKTLIFLDSNHTHEHVLAELEAYAPLTSKGSYCVVFDTVIEDLPANAFSNRPWSQSNNPKSALREYLLRVQKEGRLASDGEPLNFVIDKSIEDKLLITVAPDGYLLRA